jgi:hypothetical protein
MHGWLPGSRQARQCSFRKRRRGASRRGQACHRRRGLRARQRLARRAEARPEDGECVVAQIQSRARTTMNSLALRSVVFLAMTAHQCPTCRAPRSPPRSCRSKSLARVLRRFDLGLRFCMIDATHSTSRCILDSENDWGPAVSRVEGPGVPSWHKESTGSFQECHPAPRRRWRRGPLKTWSSSVVS